METLTYGLFPDLAAADAAVARVERKGGVDVLTTHEHLGVLDDEEIQGPGTRGWIYALLGGTFAAVLGGVLAGVFLSDRFLVSSVTTVAVAAVAAGAFGALAAIAGTSLPRRELQRLAQAVSDGKVLVTVDVETKHASKDVQRQLERCGAIRTGVLYGPGLGSSRVNRRQSLNP